MIPAIVIVWVFGCVTPVRAAPPAPVQPMLRINTEMHSAPVASIDTDATGRWVLTTSSDGTARVWLLPEGRLLRVLRAPVVSGDASGSDVDIGALSPDGKIAAVAGTSTRDAGVVTYSILLFDTSTGAVIREIPGMPQRARAIAFSPDGAYLVAAVTFHGISVWRTSTWELIRSEPEDRNNLIMDIAFDRVGRLATADLHDAIQLYDSSLRPLARASAPGFQVGRTQNLVLSFSPDGTQLAIGRLSSRRIDILTMRDFTLKFSINADNAREEMSRTGDNISSTDRLTWSANGRTLYAAGYNRDGNGHISAWDDGGHGRERVVPVKAPWMVTGMKPLKNGGVVYASLSSAWGVADAGSNSFDRPSELADFRDGQKNFRISADGMTVAFGLARFGNNPVIFSLLTRKLTQATTIPPALAAAVTSPSGNAYAGTDNYSVATATRVLIGGPLSFGLYDTSGSRIWYRPAPVSVQMANLAGDGRVVVTGNVDGTVRWYRASDGQELLALFVHPDGKRWVLWTPSGYYDAAPGSEDLIGWLVGRGKNQAPDFFPASRFADTLRRPDVISQLLKTFDEGEALRLANAASDRKDERLTPGALAAQLPPALDLISAPRRFDTESISLEYRVHTPDDARMIGAPRVKVNGQWQPSARAAERSSSDGSRHLTITGLPPHDTTIELYADNRNGTSPALAIPLAWDGRASLSAGVQGSAAAHKTRLFVLAVGISQYQRADLKLNFADHDAQQFVAAMQAQQGKAYESVNAKLLVNGEATRTTVQSGLSWLQSQVTGDDIGILFLAGHGFQTPDQNYFFAPAEFNPDHPRETGVDYRLIRQALMTFAGAGNKAIFLIDTCYSGGAIGVNLTASNGESLAASLGRSEYGVAALTAARADQLSFEDSKWGDGAFTKALLEGIVDAKADPEQSGTITVLDLGRYVSKRVPVMTEQRQAPVLLMPTGGFEDFTLAIR
jgi:WD40 repeat protein